MSIKIDEPKPLNVFVSYSWTTQEHSDRILAWCDRLVGDGVDVVIDKWSLNEGHDKYAFMEKMVSDPTITHVLIFSDACYAERANSREKGVGTESQIISAEIYGRTAQDRFLPIVCEFDAQGEPCIPVFLKGRIYFNFSTPELAHDNWERLIRRLHGKPALVKPRLGKSPAYLDNANIPAGITASKFLPFKEAIRAGRATARLFAIDYADAVYSQFEEFRLPVPPASAEDHGAKIKASLVAMLPLRNEIVEFFELVIGTFPPAEAADAIGELLESLLAYRFPPPKVTSFNKWWWDNFAYQTYELFLYAVAVQVRLKKLDGLALLFGRRYILPENSNRTNRAVGFDAFRFHSELLHQLEKNRPDPELGNAANLVKRRATLSHYPLPALVQADVLCCLRGIMHPEEADIWPPLTVVHAEYLGTLDLFLRARQSQRFAQVALAIGVASKEELDQKLYAWRQKYPGQMAWLFSPADISLDTLIGLELLGSLP